MSIILILAALAIVVVAIFLLKRKKTWEDIVIPTAPQRTDLLYGYYGTFGNQAEETKDHVNLYWEALWHSMDDVIKGMKVVNCPTVIDVSGSVLQHTNPRSLWPDAEDRLRDLFNQLRAGNVLHLVKFITPCDEPNLSNDGTLEVLPDAVAVIKKIAAEYSELSDVRMIIIYAGNNPMPHIELFDVVGFDDYDAKSTIFSPGQGYDQMRALMRPDAKTFILPGGCKGQDPVPFLNFANSHSEVLGIIPFIWMAPTWEPTLSSIRDLPVKDSYIAVGKAVKG